MCVDEVLFGDPVRVPGGSVKASDYGQMAEESLELAFRPDASGELSHRCVLAASAWATLHLAEQQRQRNVLAALTADKRGLPIPDDLKHLLGRDE